MPGFEFWERRWSEKASVEPGVRVFVVLVLLPELLNCS